MVLLLRTVETSVTDRSHTIAPYSAEHRGHTDTMGAARKSQPASHTNRGSARVDVLGE